MADQQRGRGGGRGGGRGRGGGPDYRGGGGRGGRGRGGGGPGDGGGPGGGYDQGRGHDRGGPRGGGRGRGPFGGGGGGSGDSRGRGRARADYGGRGGRGDGGRGGRGSFHRIEDEPFTFWGQGQPIPPPNDRVSRLEDDFIQKTRGTSVTQLTTQASKLGASSSSSSESKPMVLPCRPGYGTVGTEVVLWTTYFEMAVELRSVFKYTLQVSRAKSGKDAKNSEVVGKLLRDVVKHGLDVVQSNNNNVCIVSEFKSQVVATAELYFPKDSDKTIRFPHTGSGRKASEEYEIKFHGPETIDLRDLVNWLNDMKGSADILDETFPKFSTSINALGVVVGHHARMLDTVAAVGRAKFFPLDKATEIQKLGDRGMKEIIRGYFQSARPATGRLLLNANVTHGIFRRSGKMDIIFRDLRLDRANTGYMDRNLLTRISRSLARVKFSQLMWDDKGREKRVEHTILEVHSRGPRDVRFKLGQPKEGTQEFWLGGQPLQPGKEVTVAEYFERKYNKTVDPSLPLIVFGSPQRKMYVPAEFCYLPTGQVIRSKLDMMEARAMIEFACRSPYMNAESLVQMGKQVLGLQDSTFLKRFGITVKPELITVRGRILPPPIPQYAKQKDVFAREGSWNMKDVSMLQPGTPITDWVWVYIKQVGRARLPDDDVIRDSIRKFVEFMGKSGIRISPMSPQTRGIVFESQEGSYLDDIRARFRGSPIPKFAFVVLPDKDTALYTAVKNFGDVEVGMHTVCMVQSNLLKPRQDQYFANVGLKVNLKAGGANHKLKVELSLFKGGKTMVVGYDVIHPTNLGVDKEKGLPSQAGLVASIDKHLAQWPAVAWTQKSGQEMLDSQLTANFESRLKLWQRHNNNQLPEYILIYRDGVSEGQFAQVISEELPLIREACRNVYGPKVPPPKISIIVSVKRHETRFYPTNENQMTNSRNIKSGTVVDRGITVARHWDFFLTAHAALKGTARPAHYTMIHNEIFPTVKGGNAADEVEKITHEMCYLFGRATKAVSICPPAYYADIVCTRARIHMSDIFEQASAESSISDQRLNTSIQRRIHDNLKDTMYYI